MDINAQKTLVQINDRAVAQQIDILPLHTIRYTAICIRRVPLSEPWSTVSSIRGQHPYPGN